MMKKSGEVFAVLLVIGVVTLAIGGLFIVKGDITGKITGFATRETLAATVSFVSPTPTENVSGDYIYVNVSSSGDEHYSFVDFDDDLVLWMRMDDRNSTHVFDNSSNGLHGSIENGTTFSSGRYGNASEGDGVDNYIHIEDSSAFDDIASNDEITVCAWTYKIGNDNQYGASQGVLGQYWSGGIHSYNKKSFAIAEGITAPNGGYGFFVSPDGSSWQDAHSDSTVASNEWHHLCGVVESGTVKLYIDGIQQSDTGTVGSIHNPADTPFTIGTYFYSSNNTLDSTLFYNGSVDEVLVFSRGLSQDEIRAIYNSSAYASFANNYTSLSNATGHTFTAYGVEVDAEVSSVSRTIYSEVEEKNVSSNISVSFVSPTPTENVSGDYIYVNVSTEASLEHYSFVDFDGDLIGFWRLENNSFVDESSYGNDGVAVNGSDVVSGKYGNSFEGDGNGKYVTIPDSSSLDSISTNNEMSVCTWIKPYSNDNDWGSYQGVIGQWQTTGNKKSFAIAEGIPGQGIYAFYVSSDGSSWQDAQSNSALSLNTWTHLCGTVGGGTVKLYVNGVQQTDTGTVTDIFNSDVNLTIGYYYTNSIYFNGSIDESLLFNRSLSLEEIRAIYNSSAYASFANNYTSLENTSHSFIGYGVDVNSSVDSVSRTVYSGNQSQGSSVPQITLVSSTSQENSFQVIINTDVAASTCYFTDDNGTTNTTMLENSTTSFYYEDFDYGSYDITFYCQNVNGTGDLTDSFEFRRSYVEADAYYTNSQGLDIYFDYGFNTTNETGKMVIIPDSWSALKDTTWVTNAESYFISRGYVAVPVNTRGKGLSEGSKDAFGYECLDIAELAEYLRNNSPYNNYLNSVVYLAGASGAGGKAGVCTAKYPDYFAAGHSSVGVLNLSLWWKTAGSGDVSEMENRVGCGYDECPYRYDARDASLLNYNTQSAVSVTHNANDDRVNVNCSRDYNRTMVESNKTVLYSEPSSGGHAANFTYSHEWFIQYTEEPILPVNGTLRIGNHVVTKNFTIDLNNNSYYAEVDYNISGSTKYFNLTTFEFNDNASFTVKDLSSSTNYSLTVNNTVSYYTSDADGDLDFNLSLENQSYYLISVSAAGEYCGDGSCNNGESCSSCSQDCGSCSSGGSGGSSGGSSSSNTVSENNFTSSNITGVHAMSSSTINNLISKEGDIKTIMWTVKNTGTLFLNDCKLEARGENPSWLSVGEISDLAAGQEYDFIFKINVPEGIGEGTYSQEVELVCKELTEKADFNIEVTKEELDFELIKIERVGDNEILITYSLTEISGTDQDIELKFAIFNENNKKLLESIDKRKVKSGSEQEFGLQIQVDKSLKGNLNLIVNLNSETYSSLVQEDVFLAPISGFSIFGDTFKSDSVIVIIASTFILIIIFLFVARAIIKARNKK